MIKGGFASRALAVLLWSQAVQATTIITFQQWRFTNAPANPANIPADFPNPNGASASAPGSGHAGALAGMTGSLILQGGNVSFTVPNTPDPLGTKLIDITLIYRLTAGGTLGNTRFNMPGFTGVFPPNFNTALPQGWFQADFQFLRNTDCPASETLTVRNTELLAIDFASIRTECTVPMVISEPSTRSLFVLGGAFLALGLGRRIRRRLSRDE